MSFNSLYEIPQNRERVFIIGHLRAFNSLYEILTKRLTLQKWHENAFNSLYEILKSYEDSAFTAYKIPYSFNSLYEILRENSLQVGRPSSLLSILFMRFIGTSPGFNAILSVLSILFMRFRVA